MENTAEPVEFITEWPMNDTRNHEDNVHSVQVPGVASFFLRNTKSGGNKKMPSAKKLVQPREENEREPLASVSLSRWWRNTGKSLLSYDQQLPKSTNPNTLLSLISRSGPGMKYIQSEIKRLRQEIEDGMRYADVHASLGSFYEKLGNLSLAIMHFETALEKDPDNPEYKWMMAKLKRMLRVRAAQEKVLVQLNVNSKLEKDVSVKFPAAKQVDRIHYEDLSFENFFFKYALTSTPVVITGLATKMITVPWTLQYVKEKAGSCLVTVKRSVPDSVSWARLEDAQQVTVGDFIDTVQSVQSDTTEKQYLFDWSLPLYCPELAGEITMPKYFAGDFLQRTTAGSLYKDSWPSLFIAPAGLTSELHVDAFASNFWMALFEGRKRWMFFDPVDMPMLYPQYEDSLDPVFDVDLSCPDLKEHPLLQIIQPRECILQPGDVLFVPSGCPHRVENLEVSLAISGNFVDLSNFDQVQEELEVNSLLDPRAKHLLNQFSAKDFRCNMATDITDMKWEDFKNCVHQDNKEYGITPETVKEWISLRMKQH